MSPGDSPLFTFVTLYHNPQCSKSREALDLLEKEGIEVKVVNYLKAPLTKDEAERLLVKLNGDPKLALREDEEEFQQLGLAGKTLSRGEVAALIAKHPRLLQRPIAVRDGRAIIARPPEKVLTLLD